VAVCAYNPSTREAEAGKLQVKASLSYIVSSRHYTFRFSKVKRLKRFSKVKI
jgi:hypothetical protein